MLWYKVHAYKIKSKQVDKQNNFVVLKKTKVPLKGNSQTITFPQNFFVFRSDSSIMAHYRAFSCIITALGASILILGSNFSKGGVYNITPSSSDSCLYESCLTLNDFIIDSGIYFYKNITLRLLDGNHTLNSELTIMNMENLSINSATESSWINCGFFGTIIFINVRIVTIEKIIFWGCGDNYAKNLDLLILRHCTFHGYSGAALVAWNSSVAITNSTFLQNTGSVQGPLGNDLIMVWEQVPDRVVGGAICIFQSQVSIHECLFERNHAEIGGAIFATESNITISKTTFTNNSANALTRNMYITRVSGSIMLAMDSVVKVEFSNFSNNSSPSSGSAFVFINVLANFSNCSTDHSIGTVFYLEGCNLRDYSSYYAFNRGYNGAVVDARRSSITFIECTFMNNSATNWGGVGYISLRVHLLLIHCTINYNNARVGGVISSHNDVVLIIVGSTIEHNNARIGGILQATEVFINITNATIQNNLAISEVFTLLECALVLENVAITDNTANLKAVLSAQESSIQSFHHLVISRNSGNVGVVYLIRSQCNFTDMLTYTRNSGSVIIMNSKVIFFGTFKFIDCYQSKRNDSLAVFKEGGALTSLSSTIRFIGETTFLRNSASSSGGAIRALSGSKIHIFNKTIIANNTAAETGGGVYLFQSVLNCVYNCNFSGNTAKDKGGAIHAVGSSVFANSNEKGIWSSSGAQEPEPFEAITILTLRDNSATLGGALALDANSKIYGYTYRITFNCNAAEYGGAIYVEDQSYSSICANTLNSVHSASTECFMQVLNDHGDGKYYSHRSYVHLHNNYASKAGSSLYGGLLDRCSISALSDVYFYYNLSALFVPVSGVAYFQNVTYSENISLISSDPVRVCFCRNETPDCDYQWPTIIVKKGYRFSIHLVAVDQVNHTVTALIRSFLSSQVAGLKEGQQSQRAREVCTHLFYNVYSPRDSEQLALYAEGPCNDKGISQRSVEIKFLSCTCPIGFQPSHKEDSRCECDCDQNLSSYITGCNATNSSLLIKGNIWIDYITIGVNISGYLIHPNCPYDYCLASSAPISINLNIPNGADTQCAFHHSGLLCGKCQPGYHHSISSSQCIRCSKEWIHLLITVTIGTLISGIILVGLLLILNLTVAVGTLNGMIFYANIVAAKSSTFLPFHETNFATIFLAWLNLNLGFDVCIMKGIDAYTKAWLQLIFPVYIIVLVVIVIFVGERSPRFTRFIGRGNPVATLATLILLSYAKLLQVTINVLSFAILQYPNGSKQVIWLPDASVKYLRGKHIPLFLVAVLIVILGVVYTVLLTCWQWILRAPNKKVFGWIRNTRLNSFMDAYHAPYVTKNRYWTGLLLLMRIILYLTSAMNVHHNPRDGVLSVGIIASCLVLMKIFVQDKLYKNWLIDVIEIISLFNLLLYSLACFHALGDIVHQRVVAFASISIAFTMFVCVVLYHVVSNIYGIKCLKRAIYFIRKKFQRKKLNELQLALITENVSKIRVPTSSEVRMSPDLEL